jgi:transcriptional regulator with XRE-family HTH domain
MKQIHLAKTIGVAKSSVSRWCNILIQPPLSKLNELVDAIQYDIINLIVSKKKK